MNAIQTDRSVLSHLLSAPVIVASLGYFVDVYDLLIFGIVRIPSLKSMGLSPAEISTVGASILNWQMTGLFLGGLLWGVLGDKKGRLSVLFSSIITYSVAHIACAYVNDPETYKVLRFIAGIGLAGELGAGITLVSEILPKEIRSLGSSLIGGIGMLGAVFAYFTFEIFDWRNAYLVGGGMGVLLLLLRMSVFESGIFEQIKNRKSVERGNFFSLFTNRDRFFRYLKCIGIGIPFWFVISILATFSDEFGRAFGIQEPIKPGLSIMWAYIGISISDFACGVLSHWLQSRKKAVAYLMVFALVFSLVYLFLGIKTAAQLYTVTVLMGLGIGYWALFVTISAEQFGTNLRATAATTVPNMVRGTVILMTTLFMSFKGSFSVIESGALVGILAFGAGLFSILTISETHGRDLDFLEK